MNEFTIYCLAKYSIDNKINKKHSITLYGFYKFISFFKLINDILVAIWATKMSNAYNKFFFKLCLTLVVSPVS